MHVVWRKGFILFQSPGWTSETQMWAWPVLLCRQLFSLGPHVVSFCACLCPDLLLWAQATRGSGPPVTPPRHHCPLRGPFQHSRMRVGLPCVGRGSNVNSAPWRLLLCSGTCSCFHTCTCHRYTCLGWHSLWALVREVPNPPELLALVWLLLDTWASDRVRSSPVPPPLPIVDA